MTTASTPKNTTAKIVTTGSMAVRPMPSTTNSPMSASADEAEPKIPTVAACVPTVRPKATS